MKEQRDDMYSLEREGLNVHRGGLIRLGQLDRSHMFFDGIGEIFPASKIRSERGVVHASGRTLKLGPPHSHDELHMHLLEEAAEIQRDLIERTRRRVYLFRSLRKERRDR